MLNNHTNARRLLTSEISSVIKQVIAGTLTHAEAHRAGVEPPPSGPGVTIPASLVGGIHSRLAL